MLQSGYFFFIPDFLVTLRNNKRDWSSYNIGSGEILFSSDDRPPCASPAPIGGRGRIAMPRHYLN
jgi:hypothetical protein